jgi:hypothetical protein
MKKTNVIIAIVSGIIALSLVGIYDFKCLLTIVGIVVLIGMLFVLVKTIVNGYVNIKDYIYEKKLKKLQKTLDK